MRDAVANRFTFGVMREANKAQIAADVKKTFGVKVIGVKTTMVKSRAKRTGRRRQLVMTAPIKKAIIEVEKGQKIDLFDVTEKQTKK